MKKLLYAVCAIAIVCFASLCYSQNTIYTGSERAELLARSDSLFAIGVNLYNAGKYAEAIPIFTESDKIDKTALDSTSNRRDYSAMWLASCYYKLNDTITAESINSDYYMVEPVDRRISVMSDSLEQIGLKCMMDNNLVDAIKYFTASAQIYYTNFGENVMYANTLYVLSTLYLSLGTNTNVIIQGQQYAIVAARIISSIYGENSLQYEATLKILANSYALLGDYQKAKDLTITAREIDKKILGVESEKYRIESLCLAQYFIHLEQYEEALNVATESLSICKKISDISSLNYAYALTAVGECYLALNRDAEAIETMNKSANIYEQLGKDNSGDYVQLLNNLGQAYHKSGNSLAAVSCATKALDTWEKMGIGTNNLYYSAILNNRALYNMDCGNYVEAATDINKSLSIKDQSDNDYAISLSNLALCQVNLGNYIEAQKIALKAQAIGKNIYGQKSLKYATLLSNLGLCYNMIDDYQEAIRLTTEASEIRKGKDNYAYSTSLSNLAEYYFSIGNYGEAIRLSTEAANIERNIYGYQHLSYAKSLANCAKYYNAIGDVNKGLNLRLEATKIIQIHSDNNADNLTALFGLLDSYIKVGQFQQAINLLPQIQELLSKTYAFDYSHPLYASCLSNLAFYLFLMGDFDRAYNLEDLVSMIIADRLGYNSLAYANSLSNKALFIAQSGNYKKSIESEEKSIAIKDKSLGKTHASYIRSLYNLGLYYYYDSNIDKAIECFTECAELVKETVYNTFAYLTANEKYTYWDLYKNLYYQLLPSMSLRQPSDKMSEVAYNGLLFARDLLLDSEAAFKNAVQGSKDAEIVESYNQLKTNRLILQKLCSQPIAERRIDADSLETQINIQEHNLLKISNEYCAYTKNLRIEATDVKAKLTKDDIAVEFASFQISDTTIYCAYLLKPEYESPKMKVCLKQTDRDIFADAYSDQALSQAIWGTLANELACVKNIYFAPAGELYNIAIESLPDWENQGGLVSDRWNFYRLSSTRELALVKDKKQIKKSVVYGGLKFDADIATMARDSKRYNIAYFMPYSSTVNSNLYKFEEAKELPATMVEATSIHDRLKRMNVVDSLRTDTIGTEPSFKAMSGQHKNLIHIATHGFYWSETEAKKVDNISFLCGSDDNRYQEDKALTRSGLLFAGANNVLKGRQLPSGVDDGILTAQEISQLDLSGLDLVVLSACETGLGEITGDGVFGLQRGFKKAGAQSIMMSLWKVDDAATQILMTQFYTNLTSGKSKRQSLLDAQRYLREYEVEKTITKNGNLTSFQKMQKEKQGKSIVQKTETRKVHPYSDPKYWAAFILLDAIN